MKYVYNQGLRNIYWLTCQLFFVIFLKLLGIEKISVLKNGIWTKGEKHGYKEDTEHG